MSGTSTRLAAARAYVGAGYTIFAAVPDVKMSHTSAARSNGERWGATKDLKEIEKYFTRWPCANIGMPTGTVNKCFVVETDTPKGHGDGIDGEAELARLIKEHGGEWPRTRMAQSPSGSKHYHFQNTPRLVVRNSTGKLGPGIDVRGEGRMVIVPPSVRRDGIYKWIDGAPLAPATTWLLDLVAKADVVPVYNSAGEDNSQCDLSSVADLVAHLPDSLSVNHDDWRNVGLAIYAATNGSEEGFKIFDDFSKQCPEKYNRKYTTKKCWSQFRNCPPTRTGIVGLFADQNWLDRLFLAMNNLGRDEIGPAFEDRADQ